jgi:hypothetical protein
VLSIKRLQERYVDLARSRLASLGSVRLPRWSDMRPLLLRSAGVVGLAGLIMAVVSNERLFMASEEAEPIQSARLQVPDDAIEPRTVAAISVRDNTAYSNPVPGVFAPPPGARSEPTAPVVPAAAAAEQTAALGPSSAAATPPAAEPSAVVPVKPATPPTRQDAEETTSAAPGAECPRDWIAVEGEEPLPTQCDEAAPLIDLAALPDEQRAIEDAALERAAEIAGLEFAPRVPQIRPDPPPVTHKASRSQKTALAKWPADPPPKCGDKRAKWRYVNRVPTWYCR